MRKVLIANRGEIAVRVIRACRDAGLGSVAVYADSDRDALHATAGRRGVRARRATPRPRPTCASTSCSTSRARSGADAVHPGYGFLSENADFAQAVIDAGLTWIGPTPQAIRDLGDKVTARHIAQRAGAPLVPGTADPVAGADEVVAFAERARPAGRHQGRVRRRRARPQGRPHHGGDPGAVRVGHPRGGRRVRPGRVLRRALPRPAPPRRGAGPRRPARQRDRGRHPRLLAAAPAPEAGRGGARAVPHRRAARRRSTTSPRRSAARPATTAPARSSTWSARDGTISFLEVNTRLQVEHPVTEETAGIDLVREQFRIADGEKLRFTEDPAPRGHSIEFRINGEDPGRSFLPAPGTVTALRLPDRPGRAGRHRHRGRQRRSAATSTRCWPR